MTKYVLVPDSSLAASYRNFPLLEFMPSAPTNTIPAPIYNFLKGPLQKPLPDGSISVAPYSLRKLEAALRARHPSSDVVVAHEAYLDRFIKSDTEVIAVSTMDPLGYGPLTMSFFVLLGSSHDAWVKREWLNLISKINALRKGKKAKLLVGGPGVWEFTIAPEELEREGIDYAFQGECDDLACELFEQVPSGNFDPALFHRGYVTIDDEFHRTRVENPKFISRSPNISGSSPMDKIPPILGPAHKGMVEIMRGCGIGCDFCEVTLRPLRYFPLDHVRNEIGVNVAAGFTNAWLHTDEFFAYKHTKANFEPNEEALVDLVTDVMSMRGVLTTNPTHGRISPAAAYPELLAKLSPIIKARKGHWVSVQVGLETGSDSLAKRHMPNKTLPLHIGPDGTWAEIAWRGTQNMTKYYWRPAFTVQCGQRDETPEDNWDTIALINNMSESEVDGRPFEFSVTPMQNVPLGLIKSAGFSAQMLDQAQLGVYYASYRHLYKMARRGARNESKGNPIVRLGTTGTITFGGWLTMKFIERLARHKGVDIEKVKRHGTEAKKGRGSTDPKPIMHQ